MARLKRLMILGTTLPSVSVPAVPLLVTIRAKPKFFVLLLVASLHKCKDEGQRRMDEANIGAACCIVRAGKEEEEEEYLV